MLRRIERDVKRFREIVRGVVKKDFRKYITQSELLGRQGKHLVSIPLPAAARRAAAWAVSRGFVWMFTGAPLPPWLRSAPKGNS